MKTKTTIILAGSLALTALPSAFAADAQFKQMDANSDNRVSHSEYIAEAQVRFNKLDTNADGVISAAELYSIPDPLKTGKMRAGVRTDTGGTAGPGTPAGRLGQADKNGDGQISRAENEADAEAHFAAMDADRDGTLTEKELDAGVRR